MSLIVSKYISFSSKIVSNRLKLSHFSQIYFKQHKMSRKIVSNRLKMIGTWPKWYIHHNDPRWVDWSLRRSCVVVAWRSALLWSKNGSQWLTSVAASITTTAFLPSAALSPTLPSTDSKKLGKNSLSRCESLVNELVSYEIVDSLKRKKASFAYLKGWLGLFGLSMSL